GLPGLHRPSEGPAVVGLAPPSPPLPFRRPRGRSLAGHRRAAVVSPRLVLRHGLGPWRPRGRQGPQPPSCTARAGSRPRGSSPAAGGLVFAAGEETQGRQRTARRLEGKRAVYRVAIDSGEGEVGGLPWYDCAAPAGEGRSVLFEADALGEAEREE